jgi:hypothetical protein
MVKYCSLVKYKELEVMKDKSYIENTSNILGILTFTIPLINFLFILNWLLKITPFQGFQSLPLLIAPLIGIIGLVLNLKLLKKSSNKFIKLGIISNIILIVLPFIYMFLGTIILGP